MRCRQHGAAANVTAAASPQLNVSLLVAITQHRGPRIVVKRSVLAADDLTTNTVNEPTVGRTEWNANFEFECELKPTLS